MANQGKTSGLIQVEINKALWILTCGLFVSLQAVIAWQLAQMVEGAKATRLEAQLNTTHIATLTEKLAASNNMVADSLNRLEQTTKELNKRVSVVEKQMIRHGLDNKDHHGQ